jgi:hypothetical protein
MTTKQQDQARSAASRPVEAGNSVEVRIEKSLAELQGEDRSTVRIILDRVAEHLGSPEAARLWLVTASPELGRPLLTAIVEGQASVVLAVLESRWGPNPTHA